MKEKAKKHKDNLCCVMVTYPSTHGVFEEGILEITKTIHENGGQVYLDGANMNAQFFLTGPGHFGADVCHLNLHKSFAIPHGGGGPGIGPICVRKHLIPFLPGHVELGNQSKKPTQFSTTSSPYGSAGVLPISYLYMKMLGKDQKKISQYAILNANYLMNRLKSVYSILYLANGSCAHEFIIDARPFKVFFFVILENCWNN